MISPRPTACVICAAIVVAALGCAAQEPETVTFPTADGAQIEADLFVAPEAKRAAIFAHGAVFDKESWHPTARAVQQAGVTALSINFRGYGNSTGPGRASAEDILGAVTFLKERGYGDIALVGGSMGGGVVLDALDAAELPNVTRVVLLAPAGGGPIAREDIAKLFIVSEGDRLRPLVERLQAESADPKALQLYPGDAHAQHLFKTEHAEPLRDRIVEFLAK